jgi:hypothetical protein
MDPGVRRDDDLSNSTHFGDIAKKNPAEAGLFVCAAGD